MDFLKSLTVGCKFEKSKRKHVQEIKSRDDDIDLKEPIKKRKISEAHQKILKNEEVNRKRKVNKINVKGEKKEKEKPIESFEELFEHYAINETLRKNLSNLNYNKPSAVQMQIFPYMLKNKQVKACAPTGSGKTLAYLLPVIQNLIEIQKEELQRGNKSDCIGIRAIVLSPTRELAQQILSNASQLCSGTNIRSHLIINTNEMHMKQFHKKKPNILITTPLKLVHFIKSAAMPLDKIEWFIMDEVDKFFEESNQTFQGDMNVILKECTGSKMKFGLFSATTTKEMTSWVHEKLNDFITVNISPNMPVASVDQELRFVGTESAKLMELRDVIRKGIQPPILVFVQSKDRAKQLFSELMYDDLNIDLLHSDRTSKERADTYKRFREGKIWILICTELMARGMDFRNVSLVVNYDLPTSLVSYVHKIGRVGRAGKTGRAITFYTTEDNKSGLLRDIAKMMNASGSKVEPFLLQLKKSTKKERVALLKKAPRRKQISTKIIEKKKNAWKKKLKKKKAGLEQ